MQWRFLNVSMDQTVASSRDTGLAGAVDPERVVMGETATVTLFREQTCPLPKSRTVSQSIYRAI